MKFDEQERGSIHHSALHQLRRRPRLPDMQDTSALVHLLLLRSLGCLVQIGREPVERSFPEFPVLFDPLGGFLEWFRVELHLVRTTVPAAPQQASVFKHAQMFRDRGQGHRVRPCEICHASVAPGEMGQDPPARWISQRGKSSVQCSRRIFNHLVNYLAELCNAQPFFLLQFAEAVRPPRSHGPNASLFTTYGIFVGSPP
jgi:hypothetical protein